MNNKADQNHLTEELDDEEKSLIRDVFHEEVVPKLLKMQARIGCLCCDFAGEQYAQWIIHFRSKGSTFEIVDFEYDRDARGFSL